MKIVLIRDDGMVIDKWENIQEQMGDTYTEQELLGEVAQEANRIIEEEGNKV